MAALRRGRIWRGGLVLVLGALLLSASRSLVPAAPAPLDAPTDVRLATTTDLYESGLLTALLADFQGRTRYTVQWSAGTSGQALASGAQGTADVLLVAAPAAEQVFVQAGAGLDRRPVLTENFLLLGPPADPAHAAGQSLAAALRAIGSVGGPFVARRDGSDANLFELGIWQTTMRRDVQHEGWYVSTFAAAAATLQEADRRNAYTLTDPRPYLLARSTLRLHVLLSDDPALGHPYHVIRVNPQDRPGVNATGAAAFAAYLLSPPAQHLIATFGLPQFGQPLYVPEIRPP